MLKISGDILSTIKLTAKSTLKLLPWESMNKLKKNNKKILVLEDIPVIFVKTYLYHYTYIMLL